MRRRRCASTGHSRSPIMPSRIAISVRCFADAGSVQQPHLVLVAPRQLELLPRIEDQEILAVEMRAQLAHARDVDDRRAVDALEPARIELAFELAHRRAQYV